MLQTGDMNRAQRRNANVAKSNSRKSGLACLTIAGLTGGSLGLVSPANGASLSLTADSCAAINSELNLLANNADGGTLNISYVGSCELDFAYFLYGNTTINGPVSGELTLQVLVGRDYGLGTNSELNLKDINFTALQGMGISDTILALEQSSTTIIDNVSFLDARVNSAAIYAEGNLTVIDSTFSNLEVAGGGGAIFTTFGSTLNITNSTFTGNQASNGSSGGAIYSQGILDISNSTFDANESSSQGGAIFAIGGSSKFINNSTFVGNSATDAAAVFLSEGGLISNSTFWNNGDDDTFSIGTDTENTYLFGNILANDNSNSVKVIDPVQTTVDLGANLYTDTNFDDTTSGEGSSILVTAEELKLSALALNQTLPTNTGTTKTVAVAEDSIAVDYYTADSPGAQEGITRNNLAETDQRGAFRPFGDGYDVGAFELGASQIQEPEVTERETLANTGIDAQANYLGLVGLGIAAILGGSAGVLRRRKKA